MARVSLLLRLPDSTEDGIGFEGKLDAIAIGSALRKAPPPQSKALAHEPHTPEARVATEVAEWVSVATERVSVGCNRASLRRNKSGAFSRCNQPLQRLAMLWRTMPRSAVHCSAVLAAMQSAPWGLGVADYKIQRAHTLCGVCTHSRCLTDRPIRLCS